jgi:hypothetical protein
MKTFASLTQLSLIVAVTSVVTTAQPGVVHAQPAAVSTAPPVRVIGVDAMVGLPTGDYGRLASLVFGGLARVEIPMGMVSVTVRGGALFHAMKSDSNASLIFFPIFGGVRYSLGASGAYLAGELGASIAYASADTGLGSASDTTTKLGLSLGGGLRTGTLNLGGSLYFPDADNALAIMGSVGFDFASL